MTTDHDNAQQEAPEQTWPDSTDTWHSHSSAESHMRAHGESASPTIVALVGLIGFAIIIGSISVIAVYFKEAVRQEVVVKIEHADMQKDFRKRQADWRQRLEAKGKQVALPDGTQVVVQHTLEEAIATVAQEYASKP